MIKTMCCLGSATLGVLLLSACGSTTPYGDQDISKLSTGDTNAVSTGGYFWTYTDHNADGTQYHATISQTTTLSVALAPTKESDAHGNVLKVTGSVPIELPWADVSTQVDYTIDPHWKSLYPDAKVPAYPAAGLGFGFANNNAPFDATRGAVTGKLTGPAKYIGVAFDMRVAAGMTTVWTSFPMVGTDLPDIGFKDAFPAPGKDGGCTYYRTDNTPADGYQTCFASYRKGYYDTANATSPYSTMAAGGTWGRHCTLFSEVGIPKWANAGTKSHDPTFDPTKVLKMQWDMFQPKTGDAAPYELSIDNVLLVTADNAKDNNCDPAWIGKDPGTGDQG